MSSGYDRSCASLSKEGKIYQIEYAQKAIDNANTVTGLVCKDGVILMSEKVKESRTSVSNSSPSIYNITKTIGIAVCGYLPDGRNIVAHAKKEANGYLKNYGIEISGRILSERVATYMQMHTLYYYYRPFGTSVFISSTDSGSNHLYMIENDGTSYEYYSASQGKGKQFVKNEVEKSDFAIRNKTVQEATKDLLKILIKSFEGEKETEYDVSFISKESNGYHMLLNKKELVQLVSVCKEEVTKESEDQVI